jgi:hypothetical protein
MSIQRYDESSVMGPMNHSYLFNSMIYPFTRIVIYGAIWYQGKKNFLKYIVDIVDLKVNPIVLIILTNIIVHFRE